MVPKKLKVAKEIVLEKKLNKLKKVTGAVVLFLDGIYGRFTPECRGKFAGPTCRECKYYYTCQVDTKRKDEFRLIVDMFTEMGD